MAIKEQELYPVSVEKFRIEILGKDGAWDAASEKTYCVHTEEQECIDDLLTMKSRNPDARFRVTLMETRYWSTTINLEEV